MKLYFATGFLLLLISACRSQKAILAKDRTAEGTVTFYSVKEGSQSVPASFYADVDSGGTRIFYSFYPNDILKTREDQKVIKYSLYCSESPKPSSPNSFQGFTALDLRVMRIADSLAHAKGWNSKDISGCNGFTLEVYQMHGWPKGKKFKITKASLRPTGEQ